MTADGTSQTSEGQASGLTAEEIADQQPRAADQKACSNPTCPLRYAHRGPCAPAAGTYRPGARVTTVAELDALPVGSVVLSHCSGERARFDGLAWQKRKSGAGDAPGYTPEWWGAYESEWLPEPKMVPFLGGPFTVLFRPDAPQPAPVDGDAVGRAALESFAQWLVSLDDGTRWIERSEVSLPEIIRRARAALAAARAGEADHVCTVHCEQGQGHYPAPAQRGGEAVDREVLRVAVGGVLFNAMNYPELVQARILGQDTRPLTEKVVDAVLAARGDAAPSVVRQMAAQQGISEWEAGWRFATQYEPEVRQGRARDLVRILEATTAEPGPDGIVPGNVAALTQHVDRVVQATAMNLLDAIYGPQPSDIGEVTP